MLIHKYKFKLMQNFDQPKSLFAKKSPQNEKKQIFSNFRFYQINFYKGLRGSSKRGTGHIYLV